MTKWQAIRQRHELQDPWPQTREGIKGSDYPGSRGVAARAHKDRAYLLRAEEWLQHKPDCKSTVAKIKNHPRPWQCTCGLADYLGEARATT